MKRCHIIVHGTVQGVFYRTYTKNAAAILNIKGWVRNLPNGSVEIVAEGKEQDIKQFIIKLRKGSPASAVEEIDTEWSETKKEFSDFEIVR